MGNKYTLWLIPFLFYISIHLWEYIFYDLAHNSKFHYVFVSEIQTEFLILRISINFVIFLDMEMFEHQFISFFELIKNLEQFL